MDWQPLIDAATRARETAYAPYSEYLVGAALLTAGGEIYAGANVEHSIPALGICAERVAAAKAVSAGERKVVAVAVITESSPPAYPCGLCRQTFAEFVDDLPILVTNPQGERRETTLKELLPEAFRLDRLRAKKGA